MDVKSTKKHKHKHKTGSIKSLRKMIQARLDLLIHEEKLAHRIGSKYQIDPYVQNRNWLFLAVMFVNYFKPEDVETVLHEFTDKGYNIKKGIRRRTYEFGRYEDFPVVVIFHGLKAEAMENRLDLTSVQW